MITKERILLVSLLVSLLVFLSLTFFRTSLISNNYKFNEKEYSAFICLWNVESCNNKEGILWDDEIWNEECVPCHRPYPLLWQYCQGIDNEEVFQELNNILWDDYSLLLDICR